MDKTETDVEGKMREMPERRRNRRRQVLKRGKLVFGAGGSTIDCLVLDESPQGVRVEVPAMTPLPERLRIYFGAGETYDAIRLWAAGTNLGLNFLGARIYDEESQRQRKAIRQALSAQGVQVAVHMLQDVAFFKSQELQEAAVAAELALQRLSALLE